MISWMQKHKKYLVITIWISTIAFVGAGFVGWGAYKFGSSGDVVAEVGDVKVEIKELQQEYSRLYNYYAQIFQGNFDNQKAKELGLEKQALQILIQQALLENFAKEHGLIVTDEEVAQKIASMDVFKDKSGKFSKEIYLQVLTNNRLKPKDFEEQIRKEILLQKVTTALEAKPLTIEHQTIGTALFIGDKIEYLPLDANSIEVNVTKDELHNYYEKHKMEYLTPTRFKVALIEVPLQTEGMDEGQLKAFYEQNRLHYRNEEGKILDFDAAKAAVAKDFGLKKAKKEALKRYIALKKGKIEPQKIVVTEEVNSSLPAALLQALKSAKVGTTIKPKQFDNGYVVAKLIEKIEPTPMPFQEAFTQLQRDYRAKKRVQLLQERAKNLLPNFQGSVTDYICQDDEEKLKLLNKAEAAIFLKELFTSPDRQGMIKISNDKIVLYKILDQKLDMKTKKERYYDTIQKQTDVLKQHVQESGLLKKLQSLYSIRIVKGF